MAYPFQVIKGYGKVIHGLSVIKNGTVCGEGMEG